MKKQIIEAIKNFDTHALKQLLDDTKSYMNVSKAQFIGALESEFEEAKKEGCFAFDDVFFGICESCNKGCEGVTFYSYKGYYLDLYIESRGNNTIEDMYVCHSITNGIELDKKYELRLYFKKDELLTFCPSQEYLLIKEQYSILCAELIRFPDTISLDIFNNWYASFEYLRNFINSLGLFECMDYTLYYEVYNLISEIDKVLEIKKNAEYAVDALIDYQLAHSERDKLIWYYENYDNLYNTFTTKSNESHIILLNTEVRQLAIDSSGYEYVLNYFRKLDALQKSLMEKYKPLPEHYATSEKGIMFSLEVYLKLHNKHLDVLERYKEYS